MPVLIMSPLGHVFDMGICKILTSCYILKQNMLMTGPTKTPRFSCLW